MNLEEIGITDRITRIKSRIDNQQLGICTQRALIVTDSYKKTEGQPIEIRRARALESVLMGQDISVLSDELIVGGHASQEGLAPIFPEMAVDWLEEELVNGSEESWNITSVVRDELGSIIPYWKGKTLKDHILNGLPEFVLEARKNSMFNLSMHEDSGLGHIILDFPIALRVGLTGLIDSCEKNIAKLDLGDPDDYKRYLFLKASVIVLKATGEFIMRYSRKAQEIALKENHLIRKQELQQIADICRNIATNPPDSFHEAIQLVWFMQLITQIETNGSSVSLGRMDQYLFPFYKADLADGRLSMDFAQELLDCFFLKTASIVKVRPSSRKALHGGITRYQNLTLGGQTPSGQDATNDLTYLCFNAREHCNTVDPQLSLRVHRGTPESLLQKAARVIRKGGGHPALFSDEVFIPSLLKRGVPIELARDYAIIGCVEIGFIGLWGRCDGGYINLVKPLELAFDQIENSESNIKSFDDFYERFSQALDDAITCSAIENNWIDLVHQQIMPHVFVSCFVPGCITSGRDVTAGGAQINWTSPMGVGLANIANSLYAIKHLIFDEKRLTLSELRDILKSNYEGNEVFRQELLSLPKFGNDEDEVDLVATRIVETFFSMVEKRKTCRGGGFVPALYSLTSNVPLGWATGATPDGRKTGEPFADGISPTHGTDKKGPTAVMMSTSKVDWIGATGGIILNQKLSPDLLKNDQELSKFITLIRTYLQDLDGPQIQFNVVSRQELLEAQKYPDKYRNLIVRVTGYSARFTDLSKSIQDDIISRTEYQSF